MAPDREVAGSIPGPGDLSVNRPGGKANVLYRAVQGCTADGVIYPISFHQGSSGGGASINSRSITGLRRVGGRHCPPAVMPGGLHSLSYRGITYRHRTLMTMSEARVGGRTPTGRSVQKGNGQ